MQVERGDYKITSSERLTQLNVKFGIHKKLFMYSNRCHKDLNVKRVKRKSIRVRDKVQKSNRRKRILSLFFSRRKFMSMTNEFHDR